MMVEPTKIIRIQSETIVANKTSGRCVNPTSNHTPIQNKFAPSDVRIRPSQPAWRFVFYGPRKAENAKLSKRIKLGDFKKLSVN